MTIEVFVRWVAILFLALEVLVGVLYRSHNLRAQTGWDRLGDAAAWTMILYVGGFWK